MRNFSCLFCGRLLVLIILISMICPDSQAQLFGTRPGSRRTSLGSTQTADQLRDRFEREERNAEEFVGRRNTGFVGGVVGADSEVSSVVGLREESRPILNRPRVVRPAGMYPERLVLGDQFNDLKPSEGARSDAESNGLRSFIQSRSIQLKIDPATHHAELTGEVASEHERQMASLVAGFEPGVDTVTNALVVNPSLPPATSRADPKSDSSMRGQRRSRNQSSLRRHR